MSSGRNRVFLRGTQRYKLSAVGQGEKTMKPTVYSGMTRNSDGFYETNFVWVRLYRLNEKDLTMNPLFLTLSFVIFSLANAFAGDSAPTPEELYRAGKQKLEAKQYDEAIKDFSKVI